MSMANLNKVLVSLKYKKKELCQKYQRYGPICLAENVDSSFTHFTCKGYFVENTRKCR